MKRILIITFFLLIGVLFIPNASVITANAETTTEETTEITLQLDKNGVVKVTGSSEKRTTMVNSLLTNMLIFLSGIMGVAEIILIIVLVKNITIFTGSGGNPQKRAIATSRLIYNVIGIALCGGICIITALLYNVLR